jgi:hypothetical protein
MSSLAIILVNWKNYKDTEKCLSSLYKCVYHNFKIIVVDNESDPANSQDLKVQFPNIELLKSYENLGFTGGNNLGIKHAINQGADYVMLLNNDTIVENNFISPLLNHLEQNPKVGAVQPKIFLLNDPKTIWNAGGQLNSSIMTTSSIGHNETDHGQYESPQTLDWITGCCILLRSEVINNVGMLNEQFFAYYEDVDWSLRIRDYGWQLMIEPESIIYHKAGASGKSEIKSRQGTLSPIIHFFNIRNHLYLIRIHKSGISTLIPVFLVVGKSLLYMSYFAIRGRFSKLKAVAKGLVNGLFDPLNNEPKTI